MKRRLILVFVLGVILMALRFVPASQPASLPWINPAEHPADIGPNYGNLGGANIQP